MFSLFNDHPFYINPKVSGADLSKPSLCGNNTEFTGLKHDFPEGAFKGF